jgi:hypothetical protein
MNMELMSDHRPNVWCCNYKMIEGVVHKTRYKRGIRTYALHTVHEPPFRPYALITVHTTALNLGRPLFSDRDSRLPLGLTRFYSSMFRVTHILQWVFLELSSH